MTQVQKIISTALAGTQWPMIDNHWAAEPRRFEAAALALALDIAKLEAAAAKEPVGRVRPTVNAWDDGDDDDDPSEGGRLYTLDGGIATIRITGIMLKRGYWWSMMPTTIQYRNALRAACNDADVDAIFMVFDTPGGQVPGICDLAQDVAFASAIKPVLAYAEDCCCSAGYWVASQAGCGVYCNSTAAVGSVGTLWVIYDYSKAFSENGLRAVVIGSGEDKGRGVYGAPVTKDDEACFRAEVLALNDEFTCSVKAARQLSDVEMKEIATAHIYIGQEAVDIGLADGVCSIDRALAILTDAIGNEGTRERGKMRTPSAASQRRTVSLRVEQPDARAEALELRAQSISDLLTNSTPVSTPENAGRSAATAPASPPLPIGSPPAAANTELGSAALPRTEGRPSPKLSQTGRGFNAAAESGRGEKTMKERLVKALTALKNGILAIAVLESTSEDPEALASVLAENIDKQVDAKVQSDPMILALGAAGITTPDQVRTMLEMKALGEAYITDLRDDAKKECIRAKSPVVGPEMAAQIGATVERCGHLQIKAMRDAWRLEADISMGIDPETGKAAARSSAPLNVAVSATETAEQPKAYWERLDAAQQKKATEMGARTKAAREKFAARYFADRGDSEAKAFLREEGAVAA